MDDYNVNVLSEAKNEYSCRLVNILTPLILDGIKSIFTDSEKLCIENNEENKYLMTFQNFLSRVPKWNDSIVNEESERIKKTSGCDYLEDLLTCVHITHVKILTSVRVSQQQKKIDIEVPKLSNFIHKIYIELARKIYKNVYLFEKNVLPLQYQKNMRECELLCQESVLKVIRSGIPVEKIIRSYIDETTDEEIVHEVTEKEVEKEVEDDNPPQSQQDNEEPEQIVADKISLTKEENVEKLDNNALENTSSDMKENIVNDVKEELKEVIEKVISNTVEENSPENNTPESKSPNTVINVDTTPLENTNTNNRLSFNNTDSVLDMGTNKESNVDAPKTIERLEEISRINEAKRKAEEAEYDEDEDEEDSLKIMDNDDVDLGLLDIHDLNKPVSLNDTPVLTGVEILQ